MSELKLEPGHNYPPVSAEDVLEVLDMGDLSIEQLYAIGVRHAQTSDPVTGQTFGRILVELVRRLAILEDQMGKLTADPDRIIQRVAKRHRPPPPQTPAGVTGPNCPKCGSPSTLRSAKATGEKFWGCTSFPQCRGTSPYIEPGSEKNG